MRIPPKGCLTLTLLCGEPACVVALALNGVFSVFIAGVGPVLAAMRWRD